MLKYLCVYAQIFMIMYAQIYMYVLNFTNNRLCPCSSVLPEDAPETNPNTCTSFEVWTHGLQIISLTFYHFGT